MLPSKLFAVVDTLRIRPSWRPAGSDAVSVRASRGVESQGPSSDVTQTSQDCRDYGPRPRGILAPVSERMIWLVAMVDEFAGADGFEDVEIDQIVERLAWTPRERLDYLLDMLAFEERAHRARRIPAGS